MYHSGNTYWFQVGDFISLPSAVQFATRVKATFNGGINLVTQDTRVKVQIGYYSSKSAALHDAELLYSKGLIK
jgi:hypothetical protein